MAMARVPVSDYFEGEELGYLPDILLEKISWKLLPSDYMKLGTYLGVRMSDMGYLQCERNCYTQAYDMFQLWYRKNRKNKWAELSKALQSAGRMDMVQCSKNFMETYNVYEGFDDFKYPWISEKFFCMLSEKCPRDWGEIGIYLNLSMSELRGLREPVPSDRTLKNPVFEVLKAWKYNMTSDPSNLITVLEEELGRGDVAFFVEGLNQGVPTDIKLAGKVVPLITSV